MRSRREQEAGGPAGGRRHHPVGQTAAQQNEHRVGCHRISANVFATARSQQQRQRGGGGNQEVKAAIHVVGQAETAAGICSDGRIVVVLRPQVDVKVSLSGQLGQAEPRRVIDNADTAVSAQQLGQHSHHGRLHLIKGAADGGGRGPDTGGHLLSLVLRGVLIGLGQGQPPGTILQPHGKDFTPRLLQVKAEKC